MAKNPTLSVPLTHYDVTAVIEHGCSFEGNLTFQGTARIGGRFKGTIFTPDTLVIGEGASVEGEIDAGVVIISGEVEASIRAKHRVEIHAPATFRGSILTPSLRVDEGVIFEGSSRMVSSTFREDGAQAGPRSSRLSKPKS